MVSQGVRKGALMGATTAVETGTTRAVVLNATRAAVAVVLLVNVILVAANHLVDLQDRTVAGVATRV